MSSASASAPATDETPSPNPSDSATEGSAAPDSDADQPVAKVMRPGSTEAPSHTAEPASTSEPVSYTDGVTLQIMDVTWAEETSQGPGSFPGRPYARLTLRLANASDTAIDLGTAVLTLLDQTSGAVPRVYAAEADVQDFSGTLEPGETTTAVYAFAVPDESRSQITLVVDFDATHTSAVFRGALS